MAQTKGVAGFVQRDAKQVNVGADVPAFGVVKVHVSGDGFRVRRRRIEGVGENTRSVERIAIAMGAGSKEDRNGFFRSGIGAGGKRNLRDFVPFGKSARNFRLGGICWKLRAAVLEGVEQSRAAQARTVPAVANRWNRLRDTAGGGFGAGTGIDSRTGHQCVRGGKDVLDLVPRCQALELIRSAKR